MNIVRFNIALQRAAKAAATVGLAHSIEVRLIRDVYGKIRFAINIESSSCPESIASDLADAQQSLGAFSSGPEILFRDDFSDPEGVFSNADWHSTIVSQGVDEDGVEFAEVSVQLLDRQITGQDWLRPDTSSSQHPQRIVFFGLKGGVGRSTALALAAWGLAKSGKKVLLIDFDLESPGLSGLLLPPDRVAEYGILDWFVEDAVGQGDSVIKSMISTSPLSDNTIGAIRVAAAMGSGEEDYLSKLSRAYADMPGEHGPQNIGTRMHRLVEVLEQHEKPDVVLIDSRAGLHDLAAVSLTSLADTALLFATDSPQNWLGYYQLLSHWQRRPEVGVSVRDKLAIVRALTPKTNREQGAARFVEQSYELFANTLYDEIIPEHALQDLGCDSQVDPYHPSMSDEIAPHFPIIIEWDDRFQEFDPRLRPEKGGATEAQIDACFGSLIRWVQSRIEGV